MNDLISFTSSIDLTDGRRIYVSIEVPAIVAGALDPGFLADHAEVAQMAASSAFRNMRRTEVPF